jgi:hypothetical protein
MIFSDPGSPGAKDAGDKSASRNMDIAPAGPAVDFDLLRSGPAEFLSPLMNHAGENAFGVAVSAAVMQPWGESRVEAAEER